MSPSEYRLVGQDAAEYDFSDFRWAKLERLRRGAKSSAIANRNEALLEHSVGGEAVGQFATSSPRLDALDMTDTLTWPSNTPPLHVTSSHSIMTSNVPDVAGVEEISTLQQYLESEQQLNSDQGFSLDWPWLSEESESTVYQTGDPVDFWSQLQRI